MAMLRSGPRLVAVLGPTNTGKTHFAIERMLDHQTGMIGFPLRLLARENYDRVVKLRGARAVALITGEEKSCRRTPPISSAPSNRCRSTARSSFSRSTRSSSAPMPSAAMSSPRGCSCPRAQRDDVSRRRHDPAADAPAGAERGICQPAAPLDPDPYRAQESDAAAAAQRRRRVQPRRCVLPGRTGAPAARRHRGRARRPEPARPQCPGRHVPGRRGRLSGRDRRDRHGPQHGPRPCRLRPARASSTAAARAACRRPRSARSPAAPGGTWPTARSAPPPTKAARPGHRHGGRGRTDSSR